MQIKNQHSALILMYADLCQWHTAPWTLVHYRNKGTELWRHMITPPAWSPSCEYRMPYTDYSYRERVTQLEMYTVDKANFEDYHMLWEFYKDGLWCTCEPDFKFQDDTVYRRKDSTSVHNQMQVLLNDGFVWCGVGRTLAEAMFSSRWGLVAITGTLLRSNKQVLYRDTQGNHYEFVAPVHPINGFIEAPAEYVISAPK